MPVIEVGNPFSNNDGLQYNKCIFTIYTIPEPYFSDEHAPKIVMTN